MNETRQTPPAVVGEVAAAFMDYLASMVPPGAEVESELDIFIERRSRNGEQDPDEREDLWVESVRRHKAREERERAVAWYLYELRLARIHGSLEAEHESRATTWRLQIEQMDRSAENGRADDADSIKKGLGT